MKKVLITGADSYIGTSFERWVTTNTSEISIETLDMRQDTWREADFSSFDSIFHVAGIAHADVGSVSEEQKELYYKVNCDLAVECAKRAKAQGVGQFIFMSSIIVYGDSAPVGESKVITGDTPLAPANFYGDSKVKAEEGLKRLEDADFKLVILRPPMIYGRGSKGNYPLLAKLAGRLPFFPDVVNERSMLYVENLCCFVSRMILNEERGVFFPQNREYVNTAEMVRKIALLHGRRMPGVRIFNPLIRLLAKGGKPKRLAGLMNKAFGNLVIDKNLSEYREEYRVCDFEESLRRTEEKTKRQHILVISQYFYPEEFRINDICKEWIERGYEVTVITGIPNYPKGKFFDGYGWFRKTREEYEGIHVVRLPILPRGKSNVTLALNYASFVVAGFLWKLITPRRADKVFIFEVSPMTQALVGVWFARRRKLPCYIYVQDLWPENVEMVTGLRNQRIIGAIDKMVDYIYKNCTGIFATSQSFVERLEERESVWQKEDSEKKSKVTYWPQYAEDFYAPAPKRPLEDIPSDDFLRIAFTGNIGYAQGLEVLPKAAVCLREKNCLCKFVMIGDGRYLEKLQAEIADLRVEEYFTFLGRKKPQEIPKYLAWCQGAFLSFANHPLFEKTIPAKLQSYLACGMPVLAAAGGETERILNEADCGFACEPGNAEALAEMILKLMRLPIEAREHMAENALSYSREHFSKDKLLDQMDVYLGQ